MKLIQIYSNIDTFKAVHFGEGFNVIIGRVTKPKDMQRDTHNLGKTTLVHLIDFLLLRSMGDSDHFIKKNIELFHGYVFFLEIKLNTGKYVTIRRGVENIQRVSIKLHNKKDQNFVDEESWDYLNVSVYSKDPVKSGQKILNRLLAFDVLDRFTYRKTISYFLRTQFDYNDVFHLSKFRGKHKDWKPVLFQMLGFDPEAMIEKYTLEEELDQERKTASDLQRRVTASPEEVDRINGAIEIKEQERQELAKLIDDFSFYQEDRRINDRLVENVEAEIAELNSLEYNLKYEIERLKDSIKNSVNFNLAEIEHIFGEVNVYFGDQLKRSYSDLVEFNRKLHEERNTYIKKRLDECTDKLNSIHERLKELDTERSSMLSTLKESDTFRKFKEYQSHLVKIEAEIASLKSQLTKLDVLKGLKDQFSNIQHDIDDKKELIEMQVEEGNPIYKDIRLQFNSIVKEIIGQPGILSMSVNQAGNIEYNADIISIEDGRITSKADGFSYKKILCVAFDLAVLIVYLNRSFYRFVYHDGVLEGLDNRKKVNFIKLIRLLTKKFGFQYILTLIEDDTPRGKSKQRLRFREGEIALILDDSDNHRGRLFQMAF
jgi:uncharacterized protein YydD (DUF2326 family)